MRVVKKPSKKCINFLSSSALASSAGFCLVRWFAFFFPPQKKKSVVVGRRVLSNAFIAGIERGSVRRGALHQHLLFQQIVNPEMDCTTCMVVGSTLVHPTVHRSCTKGTLCERHISVFLFLVTVYGTLFTRRLFVFQVTFLLRCWCARERRRFIFAKNKKIFSSLCFVLLSPRTVLYPILFLPLYSDYVRCRLFFFKWDLIIR